jgi:hypothetical protein
MVMAILWDNMLDSNVKPGRTWNVHAQQMVGAEMWNSNDIWSNPNAAAQHIRAEQRS